MKYIWEYDTIIGKLKIAETDCAISNILFENAKFPEGFELKETPLIKAAFHELSEYFEGKRKSFSVPINEKGTEFQKRVWAELRNIPWGEVRSYKDIAVAIGNPNGSRAVGMANNKNPLPIITPCHRVIGANGSLVGFGGGLDVKIKLLDIEKNK